MKNRLISSFLVISSLWGALSLGGCATTKYLETKTVNFRCDSKFNDGLILPVDVVFVPKGESIETVTSVSPDEWFDSKARDEWPNRQGMSFRADETRKTIEVELEKPKSTIAMVIIADYRDIKDSKPQIIVFDTDAKEEEDVFITINGLLH